MKKLIIALLLLPFFSKAQNSLMAVIRTEGKQETLAGVTITFKKLKLAGISDSTGKMQFNNVPDGTWEVVISSIGYKELEMEFVFPVKAPGIIQIFLEPLPGELEEVTVNSTRSNRSIRNTPTRVEFIAEEEVHEEATMRPGDIRMLLAESTGIQTQQTSPTTGNAGIRIQGMDGRYTQILKDGFPVFSGAAGGLGLLQTPPLDLRQVEIIKGSSSTLYGGGAIAGLINLITKVPADKMELNFHFNATSAGGLDINSFYGQRFKKAGVTFFVSRNTNMAYDPANISFSAIPKFERYTLNPKLFFYFTDKTKFNFGVNTTFENRLGGDMQLIEGRGDSTHSYFERNKTKRLSTQFTLDHQFNDKSSFKLKNSAGYFNRIINSRDYSFNGTQYSSFTEATFVNKRKASDWVAGLNVLTDHFKENQTTPGILRNYNQTTLGIFIQNTWNTYSWLIVETGLRGDYVNDYGAVLLPRISALFTITPQLTSRIGGGLGYKTPTIFTEESEKLLYKNVMPVNAAINKLEKSVGANWDLNYKTSFQKISFSLNQFFFYTLLKNPLFIETVAGGFSQLQNIPGQIVSRGAETNIRLGYQDLALYLGYTYTNAKIYNNSTITENRLTPKHRFNGALVYEIEDKWKFGSEFYYFSKQKLSDGTTGRDYWLTGLVVEKLWKPFSLFINFENFGDVRQTKFESIFNGTLTNPVFKDSYAPLEGFVANGGLKIRL
ncbi:TonB-dependent receptor plug domain-containing protein [Ferruginibacter sp.]|uniref:TonB-dependent receptor n=1 Tax=Ferruginibacter sp. TaxID=1940288 RepID=UPI0026594297|nr:TonB-dependent receptor plug domain-containing protein [Ferruginibacter sp.]